MDLNALFYVMDRYRMFAFGSGQGAVGFQLLEHTVTNVGTTGYHCKELAVHTNQKSWFQSWELEVTIASNFQFPKVGTDASQRGNQGYHDQELPEVTIARSCLFREVGTSVPNLGTIWVTLASKCRSPEDGTYTSKPGNHRLPLQELPVPQGWN